MGECNSTNCIIRKIRELNDNRTMITNCFIDYNKLKTLLSNNYLSGYIYKDSVYIFEKKEGGKYLYFYCKNENELINLGEFLQKYKIQEPIIVNVLINNGRIEEYKATFEKVGFECYKKYIRKYLLCTTDKIKAIDTKEITFAKEDECKEIYKLINENFDKFSDCIPTLEEIEIFVKNKWVLTVRVDAYIAGILIFEDKKKTSYIRSLYINEKYRNKKFASKLLDQYFFMHSDMVKFTLWVDDLNYKAKKLYTKRGYLDDNMKNYIFVYDECQAKCNT